MFPKAPLQVNTAHPKPFLLVTLASKDHVLLLHPSRVRTAKHLVRRPFQFPNKGLVILLFVTRPLVPLLPHVLQLPLLGVDFLLRQALHSKVPLFCHVHRFRFARSNVVMW